MAKSTYHPAPSRDVELAALSSETLVGAAGADAPKSLDEFLALIASAGDDLTAAEQAIADLTHAHARALDPAFPGKPAAGAGSDPEQQAARHHAFATDALARARARLNLLEQSAGTAVSVGERSVARAHLSNLARKYRTCVTKLHAADASHRQAMRDRFARQLKVVDPLASEQDVEQALDAAEHGDLGAARVFERAVTHSSRYAAARAALDDVTQRQAALQLVARQVEEVSRLFADLAVLLDEQDARIDTVFRQADEAAQDLSKGGVQVQQAIATRRNSIRMMWGLCLLVLLAVAAVLIWFFVFTPAGQDIVNGGKKSP